MKQHPIQEALTLENSCLKKRLLFDGGHLCGMTVENKFLHKTYAFPRCDTFSVTFTGADGVTHTVGSSDCTAQILNETEVVYKAAGITVTERYRVEERTLSKTLLLEFAEDAFVQSLAADTYQTDGKNVWYGKVGSVDPSRQSYVVKPYILSLGQPVYFYSLFTAFAFPTAENIVDEKNCTSLKLYLGRTLVRYETCDIVLGAAAEESYDSVRLAFFRYVGTFARSQKVYMSFNSWFDHLLAIDEEKILTSFQKMADGFREAGLRPLDCYVVDDGWSDRTLKKFWGFNKKKFPHEFARISELTKRLGSGFGVWFGPRGGYENTEIFAKNLEKMGYPRNSVVGDICVANPKYVHDLCERMREFMVKYNAVYFKLDGFAWLPCEDTSHGHPVGGRDGICFYTYLYELWFKELRALRAVNPDVFFNMTTYTHSSPFFLQVADSLWINNSYDFGFSGEGDSVEACITYKDHKYYDLMVLQQAQLPPQYIYNHEPIYANERTDTRLPEEERETLRFTDAQFEKYLYACAVRGSGFVEFYYSYDRMAEGDKFRINTKVCNFLEEHFGALSRTVFHGGNPELGQVYGFIGSDERETIVSLRNPASVPQTYSLRTDVCGKSLTAVYGSADGCSLEKGVLDVSLQPFEFLILKIKRGE